MAIITLYIVNHNYQEYLYEAISSVIEYSDNPDVELLLFDNGSSDNSSKIIDDHSHYFDKIFFQDNIGLIATCNKAIEVATGRYLMRLDADDYLLPNALNHIIYLINQSGADLIYGNYSIIDRNGDLLKHIKRVGPNDNTVRHRPSHGACTAFNLDFLKKYGGYSKFYDRQDGYDIWLKTVTFGKIIFTEDVIFCYRQHGVNLTSNWKSILRTRRLIKKTFFREWINLDFEARLLLNLSGLVFKSNERLNLLNFISELSYSLSDKMRITIIGKDTTIQNYAASLGLDTQNTIETYSENILITLTKPYERLSFGVLEEMIISTFIFKSEFCVLATELNKDNLMKYSSNGLSPFLSKADDDELVDYESNDIFILDKSISVTNNYYSNNKTTYVQNPD